MDIIKSEEPAAIVAVVEEAVAASGTEVAAPEAAPAVQVPVPTYATKRVHLGNLPHNAHKIDIARVLEEFKDDIASLWIARTPPGFGFAHVREEKAEEFVTKYNSVKIFDRPMTAAIATGVDRPRGERGSVPAPRGGVPHDRRQGVTGGRPDNSKRPREDHRDGRRDDRRDVRRVEEPKEDRKLDRKSDRPRDRRRDDSRDRRRDDSRDRRRDDSRDRRRRRDDSRDRRRRRDDSRDRRRRRSSSTASVASSR
jgi:hypothetical protein